MLRSARGDFNRRFPITVQPTTMDVAIARTVARRTGPVAEEVARTLTWGADEKVLLLLAAAGFFATRTQSGPARRAGNHALLVTATASLLPHALKLVFNQTRPDRTTVLGHLHGVRFSGKAEDAFPSGHALHMGALASWAGMLPSGPRKTIRTVAIALSMTRILVLAHWASDVVVGFALGAAIGRLVRPKIPAKTKPRVPREPAAESRREALPHLAAGGLSGARTAPVGETRWPFLQRRATPK